MRSFLPGLVLLLLLPATVSGQAPAGTEFQINTYTTSGQTLPAVASDANGNFVVVWESYLQDGNRWGIFGQRFSAAGVRQGNEFQINSFTTGYQQLPSMSADANGNFVVVWSSYNQDNAGWGVFGQRFNAAGVRQGGEFRINSYTTSQQQRAVVGVDVSGSFVVAWQSKGQDGTYGVFARIFDAAGAPQGSDFQVNTYTTGTQSYPAVAPSFNGNFVVVWHSSPQDHGSYGVFGRRFDPSGAALGGEFQINSWTTGIQRRPIVASDASGNFVVVWSGADAGDVQDVMGQRFDASGSRLGSEFRINSQATGIQSLANVSSDADGNFVVVWLDYGQDGSNYGVFARRFDASGVPQASEFRVNTYTTNKQYRGVVASNPDGDFVVVWQSANQDGNIDGIFAQRYGDIIFQDGFDSGSINSWSSNFTDGTDLSVSGAAAMAATGFGLAATVNDLNGIYVQDDTPSSEGRYRARFYFDPAGFDPGEANAHFRTRIFIAFDDTGLRVLTLVLKRQGGAYSVEARVRRNDGTRADTGFFPIVDGPHFFEVDWIRASAPGASDGIFTFRVDNVAVSTLTLIDNDATPVDFVRMGALSIKTGAAGTLFYDQFESRRQRFIGPE